MRFSSSMALIMVMLLAIGCGGGGGGGGSSVGGGSGVEFRTLDLTTGAVTDSTTLPDVTTTAATSTHMVFRRVPAGNFTRGQTSTALGAQVDETPTSVAVAECWIAVFELTQGQWLSLTGDAVNAPWKLVTPASVVGAATTTANRPAFGVIHDDLVARLATWNTGKSATLRLPSDNEWEYASRAGTTTLFFWGDSVDPAVAGQYAVCNDNTLGSVGPGVVGGSRFSNGLTLWDTHGNVREWVTTSGQPELRGGSWADNLLLSRSANRVTAVDKAFRHALSGARLVLVP